ncbi:MAG: ATP-binding protein [Bacteroidota bacterium]
MNQEWLKLRGINGDIKSGFEELVCQLARTEYADNPDIETFDRVAAPDGGVEAYCIFNNGDEYGWQAKFFNEMGNSQWQQLDKSFKRAIETHLNLVKYFICIPLDRQDPRLENQKWFMDKWKEKVDEWQEYAKNEGRDIEFEYWGSSELSDLLSKSENEGKQYYWFHREEFSDRWFSEKLEEAIQNLDERYTPELNFDLPVARVFNGLRRDKLFQKQFEEHLDKLLQKNEKALKFAGKSEVSDISDKIKKAIFKFRGLLDDIDFAEVEFIDQEYLLANLTNASEAVDKLISEFYRLNSEKDEEQKSKYSSNKYSHEIRLLRDLNAAIYSFQDFIGGNTVSLSNNPALLITGDAGVGKSHLLADIATKSLERNQFSILLLGQHFHMGDLWTQILNNLQVKCNRDQFLGALDAKAQAVGSRIILFIDALNEGAGKKLWKEHIPGILSVIRRYPNLGIVFSVRSSYEKTVVPQRLIQNGELIKINHQGFSSHEYQAAKLFFKNYGIKEPSIPILHPEFSNPLFLKLFCEGLSRKGLDSIPEGHEGITAIIKFFLESVNVKVSGKHDIPEGIEIVQKVVKNIAHQIAEGETNYLPLDDAFTFVISLPEISAILNKSDFFQDLVSEGILIKNMFLKGRDDYEEGVYIAYERFSDYLVASYLIEQYVEFDKPGEAFEEGGTLYNIIEGQNTTFYNRGLIEAFSVIFPELNGKEFFEIAESVSSDREVAGAFIESLIWRKKETLHEGLKEYINDVIIRKHGLYNYFLETILLSTSNPDHYFNSDFLHMHLSRFSMAERDGWWVPFLHYRYPGDSKEMSAVARLIDWAWDNRENNNISDESVRLTTQTLCWFLASTNRTLRDSATKALVTILQDRISILIQIIDTFKNVNDPYILQRIYSVAYGCALRTAEKEKLKELAECIYEIVFNTEAVYPDILLRDYARGVIEFASYGEHSFGFELEKIRPPYKSKLQEEFPTIEEIEAAYELDYKSDEFEDYQWSQNSIISSMKTNHSGQMYGDFGRYVFESAFDHWKDVDVQGLSNLAVKWIFEKYGYDVEKHGEFDRNRKSHTVDRHYVKEERIGKKYQWIAFYELLARVSDNYDYYENSWSSDAEVLDYEGPWEPYVRDIDPTILIKETLEKNGQNFWWDSTEYSNWNLEDEIWIHKKEDLPNPEEIISVTDPNGVEWLVLEIYPKWSEPRPIGKDKYDHPHKHLWYQLRSYLFDVAEYERVVNWAKQQDFMGRWMPESVNLYQMFSREYYWSPAYNTFNSEYYGLIDRRSIIDKSSGQEISKAIPTAINYMWEEQYDASKESTLSFLKPAKKIFDMLCLKYSKVDGELVDDDGSIICFDPCTNNSTHSCLLVRKSEFLEKLDEVNLNILWTLLGEKQRRGVNYSPSSYLGRLEISGVVYFEGGDLKSEINFTEVSNDES